MRSHFIPAFLVIALGAVKAETLLDETFDSGGLPPGWQVVDNSTGANNPVFSLVAGHDGSGGSAGQAAHLGSNIDSGPNTTAGGFLLAPVSLEPRRSFSLTLDLRIDQEGTIDDAKILIGNLIDGPYLDIPFSADGQAINNDLRQVTNRSSGDKTVILEDYGPAYVDNTWYRVEIQWSPVEGRTGTLGMQVYNPANGALVCGFTQANLTLHDTLQLGFGTANDQMRIDNVKLSIVPRTALMRYYITTTDTLEAHRNWPNRPSSVFPVSKLDFRNLEGTSGVSNSYFREGEIGEKENNQYSKFVRIQGYIVPPETGSYRFHVAGRDVVSFHLGESESPVVTRIAVTPAGGSDYQAWDAHPSQTSAPVQLVAGDRYYFELHYDAPRASYDADQSFSAAWSGPGFSRKVLEGDDMQIHYPWKDVPKPARQTNGYAGKIGTWIMYWNGSSEGWWLADSNHGSKYRINGEWKNMDWTDVELANDAFNQIKAAGVDFVIFDMTNGNRWYERSRTFQMMAAHKGLEICFARDRGDSLSLPNGEATTDEIIWRDFAGRGYFGWRNYLQVDAKPLMNMYDTNSTFQQSMARSDAWFKQFTYVNSDGYTGDRDLWGWQLRSDGAVRSARGMFVSGATKSYAYQSNDPWHNSYHYLDYNWLLAKTHNPDHIIAGAWDDQWERNMWCIMDQSGVTDPKWIAPDQDGSMSTTARYDRVRQWINETPRVIPGGAIRDGAYKMINARSGFALCLQGSLTTTTFSPGGYYAATEAYAPGCLIAQNTVRDNINAYVWVSHLGGNEYEIMPAHLGLPFEASTTSAAIATGSHIGDSAAQRWVAEPAGNGRFVFRNKDTGKVMEPANTSLGATISQATSNGDTLQQWNMTHVMSMPPMGLWNRGFENETVFDGQSVPRVAGWNILSGQAHAVNPSDGAAIQPAQGNNFVDLDAAAIEQTAELEIPPNRDCLLTFDVYPKSGSQNGMVSVSAVDSNGVAVLIQTEEGYGGAQVPDGRWSSRTVRLRASALNGHAGRMFRLGFSGSMMIDNLALNLTPPPYSFAEWTAGYGSALANAETFSDDDGDGMGNFLEYALGADPLIPDYRQRAPQLMEDGNESDGFIHYSHTERTDDPAIRYTVQACENLSEESWSSSGVVEIERLDTVGSMQRVVSRVTAGAPKKFIRLKVEQP